MKLPLLFYLGAAIFGIAFSIMYALALLGHEIPVHLLIYGGWTMAFGMITMGVAAFYTRNKGK